MQIMVTIISAVIQKTKANKNNSNKQRYINIDQSDAQQVGVE